MRALPGFPQVFSLHLPARLLARGFHRADDGGCVPGTWAQTAHFSGVQRTLGSGFSSPEGVAVDGSGNVFAADGGQQNTIEH
jgi:hypothetical protein